jgi:hypothetical protein
VAFVTRFLSDRTYVRTAVLDTTDECVKSPKFLYIILGRGLMLSARGSEGRRRRKRKERSGSRFTVSLLILIKKRSRLSVEFLC